MKKIHLCLLLLSVLLVSCFKNPDNSNNNEVTKIDSIGHESAKEMEIIQPDTLELSLIKQGLVKIKAIDSTIMVELKYSTTDNFMNADVYGNFNEAYLQPQTAQMLANANKILKKANPNLRLLVYDATRPLSKQWVLWNTLKVKPGELKSDFVADPRKGSIHNYGCAVDLTIFDLETQQPLDMGTKYDFFGHLAYPRHEAKFVNEGKLTDQQVKNRKILRVAMNQAGFMPIESEWWHFNALSRRRAKEQYKIVK